MFTCGLLLLAVVVTLRAEMTTDYMTSTCTASVSLTIARRLQSSTSLTYSNGMDCTYTITAPSGYFVQANIRRFELEEKRYGSCVDYVDFYDGGDTSATKLHTDSYCGGSGPSEVVSTGTQLTLTLKTDSSAVYRGFDIIFAAATNAPCSTGQFACNNSKCVSSTLECDDYDHCGDSSDESGCSATTPASSAVDNSALIAGITIGLAALVLIGVVIGICVYRHYRWKLFLKDPIPQMKQWEQKDPYPVTKQYYRSGYQNFGFETKKPTKTDPEEEFNETTNINNVTQISSNSSNSSKEKVKFSSKRESLA